MRMPLTSFRSPLAPCKAPRFAMMLAAAMLGATLIASPVAAQQYPTKPVRIVVPYTPGGGIDAVARLLAAQLTEMWGQSVYVENRPGAGGNLGVDAVAKSAPDGYSFVIVSNTAALHASSPMKLSYDLMRDLTPVSLVTRAPFVLAVAPKAGVQSLKGLLDLARSRPNGLNFASAGQGTSTHLAIELLKMRTGIPALHVPYKGSGPALADLLEGRVDALFATPAPIMPHVRDNRLVAVAVTGGTRTASAPGVPTMAEAGVANFEVTVWFGFLAPAGTPAAIVNKFHDDAMKALAKPDVVKMVEARGQEVLPLGPKEYTAFLHREIKEWGEVVRKAGLKFN